MCIIWRYLIVSWHGTSSDRSTILGQFGHRTVLVNIVHIVIVNDLGDSYCCVVVVVLC